MLIAAPSSVPPVDYSWSETALYVCRCGLMYKARRWRWIDATVRPSLVERVRRDGPWESQCPSCGAPASGAAPWVLIEPRQDQAKLVLDGARRGEVVQELQAHLLRVQERGDPIPAWVLSPETVIEDTVTGPPREETTARRAYLGRPGGLLASDDWQDSSGPMPALSGPVPVPVAHTPTPRRPASAPHPAASAASSEGGVDVRGPSAADFEPAPPPAAVPPAAAPQTVARHDSMRSVSGVRPAPDDPDAGVPQVIGSDSPSPAVAARPSAIGAHVADLTLDDEVSFRVRVRGGELAQWETAQLSARPIHLRGRGYPLVGVRVIGSYMGQVGCIDALVDVGSTLATEAFRHLSEHFVVSVVFEEGSRAVTRRIEADGLEPNAALCIESARGLLARGEYPPQEFDKARRALEAEPAEVRLAPAEVAIASGAYQHIIGAREAVAALEHLERVSQKDTLARLLEVDGLPMAEYDAIRRRVLEGSLAHGLAAPRRFWRRLVASGLARDLEDYANRLASHRAEHEGEEGDLEPEAAQEAWEAIHDLCRRKNIPAPPEVRQALSLPEPEPSAYQPPPPPRRQASGEIRSGEITSGTMPPTQSPVSGGVGWGSMPLGSRLRDPGQRLRAATEVLQGRASSEDLGQVIEALEEFETTELLALLPDLNDLGPRVVPALIDKLRSDRREVRQAAAILLGMSREPEAMEQLAEHLVRETTTVWLDVARALGWYGTASIRSLCQILRQEAATPREHLAIDRVSRALAEVAVSQSMGDTQSGRDAVSALAEAADPRVSTAARRALANLAEVTTSGAQIRGEIPLNEVTEIRAFARRAYEAIMVPELEVEAEG